MAVAALQPRHSHSCQRHQGSCCGAGAVRRSDSSGVGSACPGSCLDLQGGYNSEGPACKARWGKALPTNRLSETSSKPLAVPRSRVYSYDKQNKNGGNHENCEDCGGHGRIRDGRVIFERVCKRGRRSSGGRGSARLRRGRNCRQRNNTARGLCSATGPAASTGLLRSRRVWTTSVVASLVSILPL